VPLKYKVTTISDYWLLQNTGEARSNKSPTLLCLSLTRPLKINGNLPFIALLMNNYLSASEIDFQRIMQKLHLISGCYFNQQTELKEWSYEAIKVSI